MMTPSPPKQNPQLISIAGFFWVIPANFWGLASMKLFTLAAALFVCLTLQGCTVLAIADVAASTVVYGVKTVVNVVDAVTPDIVNKKKKD